MTLFWSWIGTVPVEFHHSIKEFPSIGRFLVKAYEILEVFAGFFDNPWIIFEFSASVTL